MFNVFRINIQEMDFLSLTYIFLRILTLANSYVLFAANIDDFQAIAKKLGSQKVVDEFLQMAQDPEFQNYFRPRAKSRQYNADQRFPVVRQKEPKLSLTETGTKIDFEELVERVRERLEKEFQSKNVDKKDNHKRPAKKTKYTQRYTKTTKKKEYMQRDMKEHENVDSIYADPINYDTIKEPKTDLMPYKKIPLAKDDSYEDYKTPAKDPYIFSNEKTKENRFKIKNNKIDIRPTLQTKRFKYKTKTTEDIETVGSGEIKARTDKLDYGDNGGSERRSTGIPTRETYKMVTPNYYGKLPSMAERYDFNEPIPERDRQRENIKYIGNPPARINKKIRLV